MLLDKARASGRNVRYLESCAGYREPTLQHHDGTNGEPTTSQISMRMALSIYMYSYYIQADKQALQKDLERQLSEKDKEIAALKSENEVGWTYT